MSKGVAVLETALERIPEGHIDRALVLSTLCTELSVGSSLGRRQELANEALALTRSSGDAITQLKVLNNVSSPLLVPQLIDLMLAHTADALHRAERVGDPVLQFWAIHWRLYAATMAGDIDEGDRCNENLNSMAERLDQPTLHWISSLNSAVRAMIAGDAELATQRSIEALKLGIEGGEPDAEAVHIAQLSPISGIKGTRGELISQFEALAYSNEFLSEWVLNGLLAEAYVEAGRHDEARDLLARFVQEQPEIPLDNLWSLTVSFFAHAAIECKDIASAEVLFMQLSPFAGQTVHTGTVSNRGPVSSFVGGLATVLGRYDEAVKYFDQAAAFNDQAGACYFAAETDLWLGRMHVERNRPGDLEIAYAVLNRSRTGATSYGYSSVKRRAAAALQRLG